MPAALAVLAWMCLPATAGALTMVSVTREVSYSYDPVSGQVVSEIVDPGLDHCVETDYLLDGWGNRQTSTIKPCASTSADASFNTRVTTNEYLASNDPANTVPPANGRSYPAGAYLTRTYVGSQSNPITQTRGAYDPRFGAATSQVAIAAADASRNLDRRTEFDALGRTYREYIPVSRNADGSVVETYVQHSYVNCFPAAAAACLSFSVQAGVVYDSGRLVDVNGNQTSTATVPFISAYYVESTPFDFNGTIMGARTRAHFDALHREIARESQAYDGTWVRTLSGYDQLGALAVTYGAHKGRDASGSAVAPPAELAQWTAERDLLQRPIDQRKMWRGSDGATATTFVTLLSYNGLELSSRIPAASTPDGVDRTTYTRKDPNGRTSQSVNADGATMNMAYDAAGNLVSTIDALGNTTTIGYNAGSARFKSSVTDADMGAWSYAYDALGQLKRETDARGVVTTLVYDDMGRLTTRSSPNFVSKWYYDKYADGSWCASGLNRLCYSQLGASTPVDSQKFEYDALGRPVRTTTTLDRPYVNQTSFDTLGRPATRTYPTGFAVKYAYSPSGTAVTPGILQQVSDASNASRIFWRVDTLGASDVFDAQGHLLKAQLGNGLTVANRFDPISGKVFSLNVGGNGSTNNVVAQSYSWDQLENLSARQDGFTAVSDKFTYDVLGRVVSDQLTSTTDLSASRTVTASYNAIGNILTKSDVGGYAYAGPRPHAVTAADNVAYAYDANGNILSTSGYQVRSHAWNDFNQPDSMSFSGNHTEFLYDADYKRVKETSTSGATTRTVYLVHPDNAGGLGFEREETRVAGALVRNESRHYITVGGNVIAVVKSLDDSGSVASDPAMTNYWHRDSLGSITAVTTASPGTNPVAFERMAYDAWGRRLTVTGKVDPRLVPVNGHRGFTGHETLDELALVHMNGRIYDPALGRFLSADSVVETPDMLQSYNRYSYVLNNPLRYTDPSGHCIWDFCITEAEAVFIAIAGYALQSESSNANWKMVGTAMMMYAGSELTEAGLGNATATTASTNAFTVGQAGNAFTTAFGVTMLTTDGNVQASMQAGAFAIAFSEAGSHTVNGTWAKYASHALIGCVQSAASGGKCGAGAASATLGEAASEYSENQNFAVATAATTLAGGTASVIGGGKFANGAYQAGFGYIFNFLAHKAPIINPEGWGENSAYNLDFAQSAEILVREVNDNVAGRQFLKKIGKIPGKIVGWADDRETALCAVESCYGTRDLDKKVRMEALKLDEKANVVAQKYADDHNFKLSYMSRSQMTDVLNAVGAAIPKFNEYYGTTSQIMSHLPEGHSPGKMY